VFQRRERGRRGKHPAGKQRQTAFFAWPFLIDFQEYGDFRGFLGRPFAAGLSPDTQGAETYFIVQGRLERRDSCRDLIQAAQQHARYPCPLCQGRA